MEPLNNSIHYTANKSLQSDNLWAFCRPTPALFGTFNAFYQFKVTTDNHHRRRHRHDHCDSVAGRSFLAG